MTTELVLLLGLFVFILGGAFMGNSGPKQVFEEAAPRLGGRVENSIVIGHRFPFENGGRVPWRTPNGAPPLGSP